MSLCISSQKTSASLAQSRAVALLRVSVVRRTSLQPAISRADHSLRTRAHLELTVDGLQMLADAVDANTQPIRNLLIRETSVQQLQNPFFPLSQLRQRLCCQIRRGSGGNVIRVKIFDDFPGNAGTERRSAGEDVPNRRVQFSGRRVFLQEITVGPGLQSVENHVVFRV